MNDPSTNNELMQREPADQPETSHFMQDGSSNEVHQAHELNDQAGRDEAPQHEVEALPPNEVMVLSDDEDERKPDLPQPRKHNYEGLRRQYARCYSAAASCTISAVLRTALRDVAKVICASQRKEVIMRHQQWIRLIRRIKVEYQDQSHEADDLIKRCRFKKEDYQRAVREKLEWVGAHAEEVVDKITGIIEQADTIIEKIKDMRDIA